MKKNISPFKPKKFINIKHKFFKIYTFNAGFKKYNKDLLVIVFDNLVPVSAIFTKSTTPAAPIIWLKKNASNLCKVLIVNSGNANAFTGKKGVNIINQYIKLASSVFACKKNQIYVSSTGVIGEQLDPQLIIDKINIIKKNNLEQKNILEAAKAIMTTDTYPKIAKHQIDYKNKKVNIYGIAKGSGMIAPNMGTMLSYIFVDTYMSSIELKKILKTHVEDTFNSISVDGDTSTNDTVMIFSTGKRNDYFKNNIRLKKMLSF